MPGGAVVGAVQHGRESKTGQDEERPMLTGDRGEADEDADDAGQRPVEERVGQQTAR